jgi:nucleoside-diphosphate-sugar epimerase
MDNNINIFVSGATGFIGRRLCLELALKGHQVNALCRNAAHPNLINHPNIKVFQGDVLDEQSLLVAMQGCTQVYHTAAMAKMWCKNPDDFYQINVVGTRNVLQACVQSGVEKVVYTSTCGVFGPTVKHPMTESDPRIAGFPIHYERTKHLAELEVHQFVRHGLPVVMVHPSRVFGEGPVTDSNTVSKMIRGYLNGSWRIIPGDGDNIANYAFLDDVVAGHIAAMGKGIQGQKYILGGEDISFNFFFETLRLLSGKELKMLRIPQKVIKFYSHIEAFKTKLTGIPPVFLPEFADRLKYNQKYSSQKAIDQLNYQITPFTEGMERTIIYLQKYIL